MGYEVAQHNTAYVLEDGALSALSQEETHKRALVNWRRSAAQGEFSARVKIGDYLYYGHGTAVDLAAAADEYRMAADASNPQAMFNLAYMHEHGEGLPKDLHLAKRYYDMSLNTNVESQVSPSASSQACRLPSALCCLPLLSSPTLSLRHLRRRPLPSPPCCSFQPRWRWACCSSSSGGRR